jgi:hypothetical protein
VARHELVEQGPGALGPLARLALEAGHQVGRGRDEAVGAGGDDVGWPGRTCSPSM